MLRKHPIHHTGLISVLTFGAVLAGLTGCAPKYSDYDKFIVEPKPLVTETTYRIAPPDVINIQSLRVVELHNQSARLRPDGKITLPLLGTIFVAGMTPEELSEELTRRARTYYTDAEISVRVVTYASQKIFVFGEVASRGAFPYSGKNTVLEMMAFAQPTRLADPSRIQVLRPNEEGELVARMTIDLNDMVKRGDTSLDAVLEEGDIIYVPPNPLAAVGLGLQQVLLPIQPAASTVNAPVDFNSSFNTAPYGDRESR